MEDRCFSNQPTAAQVSRDLADIAPLQLPEELLRIHGVAFATQ